MFSFHAYGQVARWAYCAISAALIGALSIALFGGPIATHDGHTRWALAHYIAFGTPSEMIDPLFVARFLSVVQAATLWISEGPLLFTFLQAALVNFSIFLCCGALDSKKSFARVVVAVVVCVLPVTLVFAVSMTDSAWTFIGLTVCLSALFWVPGTTFGRVVQLLFLAVGSTLLFGSRTNTLVLVPALGALCWWLNRTSLRIAGLASFSLIAGLSLSLILPSVFVDRDKFNPVSLSMTWELVRLAQMLNDPAAFLVLSSNGDMAEAVRRFDPTRLNAMVWESSPPFSALVIGSEPVGSEIVRTYVQAAFDHPAEFAAMKLEFAGRVLGTTAPHLRVLGFYGSEAGPFSPLGGVPAAFADDVYLAFVAFTDELTTFARVPWPLILFVVALLVVRSMQRQPIQLADALGLTAIIYYASFLLFAQSMEFRYWASSYFVLLPVLFCEAPSSASNALRGAIQKLRLPAAQS